MKPKVYISGPITGCQLWQVRKQFSHAEQLLQQAGYRTCNPLKMHLCVWLATAFVGTCIERLGYRACLALQLVWLALTCKHIYMLPNWQNSRGASAEYHVAAAFGVTLRPFDGAQGPQAQGPHPSTLRQAQGPQWGMAQGQPPLRPREKRPQRNPIHTYCNGQGCALRNDCARYVRGLLITDNYADRQGQYHYIDNCPCETRELFKPI